MTGQITPAPFPLERGKGAAVSHCQIVAARCQDEGACIMCANCGHVFVHSNPLSDESLHIDNLQLARDVWYHDCRQEGRTYREIERNARKRRF